MLLSYQQHQKKPRGLNDVNTSSTKDDGHSNVPTTSRNKNHENDSTMVDNPYAANNCQRLLNHAANITYERDRYTTPITIEFYQKSDQTSINTFQYTF